MIDQLVEAITEIAKAAAVKLAVFAVIGVTILIGIGFLLAAVFIYLAAQFGTLGAALGLGTVLVALGLVALAIVLQRDTSDGSHAKTRQVPNRHAMKMRFCLIC